MNNMRDFKIMKYCFDDFQDYRNEYADTESFFTFIVAPCIL